MGREALLDTAKIVPQTMDSGDAATSSSSHSSDNRLTPSHSNKSTREEIKRNANSLLRDSPREAQYYHQTASKNDHNTRLQINNNNANCVQAGSASTSSLSDDNQTQENKKNKKRYRSAEEAEHHKLAEKKRRSELKELFELLKQQLSGHENSSAVAILLAAIKCINSNTKKKREYQHKKQKLARENTSLQEKLTELKEELSSKWELFDFSKLTPEETRNIESIVDYMKPVMEISTTSSIHQVSAATVVGQSQDRNLAHNVDNKISPKTQQAIEKSTQIFAPLKSENSNLGLMIQSSNEDKHCDPAKDRVPQYYCPFCNRPFNSLAIVINHAKEVHDDIVNDKISKI